jgi:hypothetical protein
MTYRSSKSEKLSWSAPSALRPLLVDRAGSNLLRPFGGSTLVLLTVHDVCVLPLLFVCPFFRHGSPASDIRVTANVPLADRHETGRSTRRMIECQPGSRFQSDDSLDHFQSLTDQALDLIPARRHPMTGSSSIRATPASPKPRPLLGRIQHRPAQPSAGSARPGVGRQVSAAFVEQAVEDPSRYGIELSAEMIEQMGRHFLDPTWWLTRMLHHARRRRPRSSARLSSRCAGRSTWPGI